MTVQLLKVAAHVAQVWKFVLNIPQQFCKLKHFCYYFFIVIHGSLFRRHKTFSLFFYAHEFSNSENAPLVLDKAAWSCFA